MAFEVGNKKGVRPTMNVTPLVDVVLVLLIIFMVITPMMVKQLSVNVPKKDDKIAKAETPNEDDEPQVVLRVVTGGQIYLNKTPVGEAQLESKLKRVFAARDDQTLFFDADEDVPFERAMNVLDRARGTGLSTIAVLTEAVN